MTIRNLQYLFKPTSITIIGTGTQSDSTEANLVRNLMLAGFQGPIMPVVSGGKALQGILSYPDIQQLPVDPQMALITRPLMQVPELIRALGERGCKAVALVTDELLDRHQEPDHTLGLAILEAARPYLLRVLGPDSFGLASPRNGVNASSSRIAIQTGQIAVVTQSAAMLRSLLEWASIREIGFSHAVSVGSKLDVDFGDMMDFLALDVHTRAILFHLEEIRNARKVMSAARIAARIKPVVVLKPRQIGGGSLVEDAIYDAAFQRAGVLRVNRIEQLFNAAETLATFKPVYNKRLAILGNSRSIGLLTCDLLIEAGGELARFDDDTRRTLEKLMPRGFSSDNPIDLGDRAEPDTYRQALEVLLKAKGIDGVLVINAPSTPERDLDKARAVAEVAGRYRRLVLTSWVGGQAARRARELLREHHIAAYDTPGDAVQVFVQVARYRRNQELLMETPPSRPEVFSPDTDAARRIIHQALEAGRDRLNPLETSQLLAAYTIPVVEGQPARNPDEAAAIAAELDDTVVLKILSSDIRQKSEVGGVAFALKDPQEVHRAATAMLERVARLAPEAVIDGFLVQPSLSRGPAYETTVGIRTGRQFGPVLRFGHGGTESEVINDIAYALPPLNMHLARDLISRTRLHRIMGTSSGRPANLEALALTLIKVSQMVIDLGELVQMDINPLWVDERGVLALDATVEIAPLEGSATRRLAIRPYPVELEEVFPLPDGREIMLRPILPEDEPALQAMVRRIPQEDLRLRFFQPIRELSHDMAARLTQIDYDREMALVVTDRGVPGQADVHGVVRMTADPDMEQAEYAIIVERTMTGLGLGPLLMRRIINYARQRGIQELFGEVLRENEPMLRLNRVLGFTVKSTPEDPGVMHVTLKL